MNSLRLDNKRRGNDAPYAFIGFIIFVVLVLFLIFFPNSVTSFVYKIERNITNNFWGNSAEENARIESSLVAALQSENAELLRQLGKKDSKINSILAAIIIRPPRTPYDSIVLDAGTNQGVTVGSEIFVDTHSVIGTITAVYPDSSLATLFSSSGQKADVLVGTSSVPAVAEGIGGGNFFMKLPRNSAVAVGDAVLKSGPNPILIGVIEKIDANPQDVYVKMYFKIPVNISNLRYVQIKSQSTTSSQSQAPKR